MGKCAESLTSVQKGVFMAKKKMSICNSCKNPLEKGASCSHCGQLLLNAPAMFVYGQTAKDACGCIANLTDRYLIVQKQSAKKTVAGDILTIFQETTFLGLIPDLLIDGARHAAKKAAKLFYGFYDLKEIDHVVFPYRNNAFQNDSALKIMNADGSDFILHFSIHGNALNERNAKAFADCFAKAGVRVVDGSSQQLGDLFCAHPFVDANTFGTRVCPSAAAFVQMTANQFIAPAIAGTATAAAEPIRTVMPTEPAEPVAVPAAAPDPQPDVRPPESPAEKPASKLRTSKGFSRATSFAPAGDSSAASVPERTVAPASVSVTPDGKRVCPQCESTVDEHSASCPLCGFEFPGAKPRPTLKSSWDTTVRNR